MSRRTAWFLMGIGGLLLVLIAVGGYRLSSGAGLALPRRIIMEGESMEPTLHAGDQIIIHPLAGGVPPERGDIVVFTDPTKPTRSLVKRVIALPGDTVEISKGVVRLNGQELAESYLGDVRPEQLPPIIVPDGQVYVLGDNRARSFDSRHMGPIPLSNIQGVWEQ